MSIASSAELEEPIRKAIKYIRDRRTPDGGYFFARVPPGSLLDSFFAVESLRLLGLKPGRMASLERFIAGFESDYVGGNIHALYLATSILSAIDKPLDKFLTFGEKAVSRFRLDKLHQFEILDIEVASELKPVFEAASVFEVLNAPFDKEPVAELVISLFNKDGGFGRNAISTLATTYYALKTLTILDYRPPKPGGILKFLSKRLEDVYFLEDLFYLVMSRFMLDVKPVRPSGEPTASLILGYQRANGGFARARPIGIPTLEYTYYALSLLKLLKTI